jgi:hypothetical protein
MLNSPAPGNFTDGPVGLEPPFAELLFNRFSSSRISSSRAIIFPGEMCVYKYG